MNAAVVMCGTTMAHHRTSLVTAVTLFMLIGRGATVEMAQSDLVEAWFEVRVFLVYTDDPTILSLTLLV